MLNNNHSLTIGQTRQTTRNVELLMQFVITLILAVYMFVCLMVFNATFNNISVISWLSVLLVEETGGPEENH